MKIILRWIAISCAVWVTSQILTGIHINPFWVSFIVGGCLTIFDMFIRPVVNILTLPLNMLTLGLFSFVINSALFWYLGTFIDGFTVDKFSTAFFGALFVSVITWIFRKIFPID